jgi:predicted CXXCH cytochrome family protein
MPHGRYSGRANLCEVCHDTHDSEDNSLARRENVNLCYYCHGAPTSTLPSSGTHGPNVQAELIDANDQTYSGESTTETTTNLFSQTTQSEFNQDTLYHTGTTLTDDGEVILSNFNKNPLSDNFNDGVVDSKWTGLDISTSGGSENETDNPGRLTVYARGGFNGLRSGRTSDNFRFTYQTTSSPTNFDMRVKIESLGNVTGRDFAGLMIRDGTASNARYIAVGFSRERGRVTTYYRRNTGGYSSYVDGTINTFPVWVRIVKNGNTYTTYESTDGETWNQIASGSGNINNFNFGLATSAGSLWFFNPPPTTAVYDNFSVPNFDIYEYYTSGTVTSVEIIPSGNLYSWDTLSWSETLNGGDITIDVLGYNGSSWDTLKTGLTNPSGESLSDIDVSTYTRLKLVAHLTRGSPTSTPYLNSWQVSYTTYYTETPSDSRHPVPEREVLCADCHTPHRDPDDYPKLLFEWQPNGSRKYYKDEELSQRERRSNRWSPRYVGNSTIGNRFCWGCHGDWNNTKINSTYYANTRGDHKTNFLLTPHNNITWTPPPTYDPTCGIVDTTSAAINCLACHLKHGSSSSSNLIGYKGNDSSTYRGNGLCYACHKAGGDAPPSGYFVGKTEYELSAHGSDSNVLWPGGEYGSSYPAQSAGKEKQCVNCHNPHGEMDDDSQGNIYPKLCVEQTFTTSSPSDGGDLCFTCHDSTGPASDKKTEFSYTDSHHPIENGNPTCNNCHNPHLSDSNTTPHRVIVDPDDVTTLYPLADVPNPDDTSTPYPDTEVFCMDCHDGSWPGAPDISYELNNRTYDPSRTVSNFWYHHDHQPNRQCRRCHSGGGTAPFERIFNGHYTHAKVGGTGNTDQNASCTYCHDPHGTPGTDPSGVQRGKMLKSWIKVNAFPYEGTSEWNGRSGGSSPISCSLNDPTGACHNVTYIHNNKRDASNSGCSRTDCHSSF